MLDPRWPFGTRSLSGRAIDVVCVGHALVDHLALASPSALSAARIEEGGMTLVDADRSNEIEQAFPSWSRAAGGSAANTAAGIASLGGSAAFAGAVGDDELGAWYSSDLEQAGVFCEVATLTNGDPTGVCHVLISDGGGRSMATSLGAAGELPTATIERVGVERAKVLYFEGYLLDPPLASAALERGVELAKDASTVVALSLSDSLVVERHADRIRDLVVGGTVDLLFGNEEEAMMLTGAASRSEAVARLRRAGTATVMTLGSFGAIAVLSDSEVFIASEDVPVVRDTTGAGDLFAAGCLWGLTHGFGPEVSLRVGSFAAAEVISHLGARPAVRLLEAFGDRLGSR